MAIRITIELDDEDADRIAAAFDRQDDREAACTTFVGIATRHMQGWISGDRRYRSLTEQYAEWIEDFYRELLSADEVPDAARLYNSFNVPYGQASYIARILKNKALTQWRRKARQELRDKLAAVRDQAKRNTEKKDGDRMISLSMTSTAGLEMEQVFTAAYKHDGTLTPPVIKGRTMGMVTMEFRSEDIEKLSTALT